MAGEMEETYRRLGAGGDGKNNPTEASGRKAWLRMQGGVCLDIGRVIQREIYRDLRNVNQWEIHKQCLEKF